MDREHLSLSIARQCALMGVARSSLYYRPREASGENLALMQAMDRQYLDTPFYGSRRLSRVDPVLVPAPVVVGDLMGEGVWQVFVIALLVGEYGDAGPEVVPGVGGRHGVREEYAHHLYRQRECHEELRLLTAVSRMSTVFGFPWCPSRTIWGSTVPV